MHTLIGMFQCSCTCSNEVVRCNVVKNTTKDKN